MPHLLLFVVGVKDRDVVAEGVEAGVVAAGKHDGVGT